MSLAATAALSGSPAKGARPTRPPALSPARGPPQPELPVDGEPSLDLDQTPAFDPAEPEPLPDADFDQSWEA